jgi:hypothetical protein
MSGNFESIVTGNLAETPINNKRAPMSPTEIMAFDKPVVAEQEAPAAESPWQTVSEERWSEPKLGESISNTFKRITRKMPVEGGYIYSVATYVMTYIRGVADNSVSESLTFVSSNFTKQTKK